MPFSTTREDIFHHLRTNLLKAQKHMKDQADKQRTHVEFIEGDWVLLKLQTYRQKLVQKRQTKKLSKRYFGSFFTENWFCCLQVRSSI